MVIMEEKGMGCTWYTCTRHDNESCKLTRLWNYGITRLAHLWKKRDIYHEICYKKLMIMMWHKTVTKI